MKSDFEDQIEAPKFLKLAFLPMVVPGILLLFLPEDVRGELSLPIMAAMAGIAIVGLWMLFKARKPVLTFDGAHVEFQSMNFLGARVRLRVDEIASVEERTIKAFGGQGPAGKGREFAFQSRGGKVWPLRVAFSEQYLERIRSLIERQLGRRGVPLALGADDAATDGAWSSEHSPLDFLVLFVVVGGFLVFTLEYFFMAEEYYADSAPWGLIVAAAIVVSLLVATTVRKRLKSSEDVAKVALVALVTVGLLAYAVLPRINKWTDDRGLMIVQFTLDEDRVWRAGDQGFPTFEFGGHGPYWEQFEPGDRKDFDLRRGGLGFWQINMSRLYEEQKEFYDSR